MDHLRQKVIIFRLLDKTLDFLLIVLSIRLAIISERVLHHLPWYQLDIASFNEFIYSPIISHSYHCTRHPIAIVVFFILFI